MRSVHGDAYQSFAIDGSGLAWGWGWNDHGQLGHAEAARRFIAGRSRVVSFVTAADLRYGALRAGWGELRVRQREC